jgi:hypothetical protein
MVISHYNTLCHVAYFYWSMWWHCKPFKINDENSIYIFKTKLFKNLLCYQMYLLIIYIIHVKCANILYIKATCLSVWAVPGKFFQALSTHTDIVTVQGWPPCCPPLYGQVWPAGRGVKGGVFFFFSFFLGPPSFSWGWLEWRSHGLPTLVIMNHHLWLSVKCDFTYVIHIFLVVDVGCNLFGITNFSWKLTLFFLCYMFFICYLVVSKFQLVCM